MNKHSMRIADEHLLLKSTTESMKSKTGIARVIANLALALAILDLAQPANAANIYWDGTGTGWQAVGSWSTGAGVTTDPSAIPSSLDVANFSINTVNSAQTVNLNADQSALGLIFLGSNTAATKLQGGGTDRMLTIGASGITVNSLAGAVTVGSPTAGQNVAITLGAAQTWANNSLNGLTISNAVVNGVNLLTVTGTGNITMNGILGAGSGGLTKTGTGTLTLTAANTYIGLTTVSGGTLTVGNGTTGSLNGTTGTALTFSNSGTFNVREAANSTQGMGTLTFGAGDDTVTSTFATGATTATLTFSDVAARPAGGGTGNFTITGTGSTATSNKILLTNFKGSAPDAGTLLDKGLFFAGSSYAACDAAGYLRAYANTDSGAVTADAGASTIADLSTANVFVTGAITAQEAAAVNTINLAANALTLSAPATILQANGLLATGGSISSGILQPTADGGELVARIDSDATTITSAIQNNTSASSLTKSGGGTLTLSGVNAYTGVTTVNGGTLQFTSKNALYNNTPASWTDGNLVIARSATLAFNVGGTGEFTTTDFGNLAALGTASGGFRDGSTIGLSTASGDVSYTAVITNPNGGANVRGLTKLGANILTLSGVNTYTGPTTVSGGTLKLAGGTGTVLDNATTITLTGGSLDLNDQSETVASLVVSGNSVLSSTGAGSGALTTTTPSASVGVGPSVLTGGTLAFNSGTLMSANYFIVNGTVTLGGGSLINPNELLNGFNNNGAVLTLNSGSINSGTLSFGNFTSSYNLNGGTVETSQFKKRSTANVDLFFNGVTVKTRTGTATNVADKFLPGSGSTAAAFTAGQNAWISSNGVTFDCNGINTTVAGPLQHDTLGAATDGGLTKSGAGTLTLSGANTYTGVTKVNTGTLTLSASGSLAANSSINIAAGATFDVSAYATYTLGASAGLIASGTGTTVGTSAAAIKASTTVSLGLRPITLTWGGATSGTDSTHPPLYISQGALSLGGNQFTVVTSSQLSAGVYTLVSSGGTLSGTVNSTPLYTGGSGLVSGATGVVSISGNAVILTVTGPTATKLVFTSTAVSTVAGVASATITVERQNGSSSPVTTDSSITVTLSSSSTGTKTFTPSSLTIPSGSSSASFTYTDTKAGTPTITAASAGLTSASQQETITPGTFNWNTTDGTWDTGSANWTGLGTTWVDGNNANFNNTDTPTTITLSGARTAAAIKVGNVSANANYTFTNGVGGSLSAASFNIQGADGAGLGSVNPLFSNLTLTTTGNLGVGRGVTLVIGGTSTVNVGGQIGGLITGITAADWGTLTIQDSAIVTATGGVNGNTEEWALNLNGGTLTTPSIQSSDREVPLSTARLTFNGTTVKAMQDNANFVTVGANGGTTTSALVGNGGAIFDSNGHNIGTAVNLKPDTSSTGGVTKQGAGTLTLSGANTYTGATTVNAGTLTLGASGSLAAGSSVSIAAGATFDVTALTSSSATYTWNTASLSARGTATAATITGTSGGTVSMGTKPITLTWAGATSGTDSTHPPLTVTGASLSFGGNQFTVVTSSQLDIGVYTLVSAGTISGGSTVNSTPLFTGGSGLVSGTTGVISISGNNVILKVSVVQTVAITVANPSFELPSVGGAYDQVNSITSWPQIGGGWTSRINNSGSYGGLAGITDAEFGDIDGNNPGTGVQQDLASQYAVGSAYTLTVDVGMRKDGFIPNGATLRLSMCDASGNVAAFTDVVGSQVNSIGATVIPVTVSVPMVRVTDAWHNNAIRIKIMDTVAGGGDWAIDNVRLIATPLAVTVSSPLNAQEFLIGTSISATSTVANSASSSVTFYTNVAGGAYAQAGTSDTSSPYTANLGVLPLGTYNIYATATDGAVSVNSLTNTFTVIDPVARKLAITGITPANPVAGAVYSVTVEAQDVTGVPRDVLVNTDVTLSRSSGTAGSLGGTLTGTIQNGTHSVTISGVTNRVAESFTIQASTNNGTSLTAGTASYTIVPGTAATLTVSGFPSPVSMGAAGTVTITAKDACGNTATNYTGTIHFTSSSAATLPGNYTFTSGDAGVHAFTSGVTLNTLGTQSITAIDTVTPAITGTQPSISVQILPTVVTFSTVGTTTWTVPANVTNIELLVIAGGGASGRGSASGGGGAGGVKYYGSESPSLGTSYAVSPGNGISVTLGAGGAAGGMNNGGNSVFGTVTATGGGAGGNHWSYGVKDGNAGGSGGGGGVGGWAVGNGGAASPSGQGNAGGYSDANGQDAAAGGGGGGAGAAGNSAVTDKHAGNGGAGLTYLISGSSVAYAGGGGGNSWTYPAYNGLGGTGYLNAGGGGMSTGTAGGSAGQNGIVIVRYTPNPLTVVVSSPTNTQEFLVGASISATATVASGTAPYTVEFFTNYAGGAYASAGSDITSPYTASLGNPAVGSCGVYARVTDSYGNSANSATNTVSVSDPVARKLAVTGITPANPVAGAVYSVTVEAQDLDGVARNVTVNTDVTLSRSSGTVGSLGGNLTGTILANTSQVIISGVTNRVAEGFTLLASTNNGTSLTAGTATYTIVPAAAATLTVSGFASPASMGVAGSVTVTAFDAYGNLATNYTGTIHFTSSSSATLPGDYTFTSGNAGTHTFTSGVALNTLGTQSITATDTGSASVTGTQSGIAVQILPSVVSFSTVGTTTWTVPANVTNVRLLVVAGGGASGRGNASGGGGAGGVKYYGSESPNLGTSYAVTPGNGITVTVGAGGAAGGANNGADSVFGAVTATGGGHGGNHYTYGGNSNPNGTGANGGSGGGGGIAGGIGWDANPGGQASPAGQGYEGGASYSSGSDSGGGGGGGAGHVGFAGASQTGGNGGDGLTYLISGASLTYAGGGGGHSWTYPAKNGSGGAGYLSAGGGGKADGSASGVAGQNGIVIVRYTQNPLSVVVSSPSNTQQFVVGASISATATVASGTAPYTVQFYTNCDGGAYASAGSVGTSPYTASLSTPAIGTYGIYATVTDSHGNGANSETNTFTIAGLFPTRLVITGVTPSSPVAGAEYSVTVEAQDVDGVARNVTENTGVTLTRSSGTVGSLGGNLTGTILANTSQVIISGVTNRVAEGFALLVSTNSGTSLTAGTASYTIVPGAAATLTVSGFPSPASIGEAGSVTVTAYDAYGNLATNYTGRIHFTSSALLPVLPGDYTFTSGDHGSHTFASGVALNTLGTQSITATDTGSATVTGTQSGISVQILTNLVTFNIAGTTTWTAPANVTNIELLVVAGGGAGGRGGAAGGGGAGGLVYYGSESPRVGTSYPVTPGNSYTVTVGAGGVYGLYSNGVNSSFGAVVAKGGGAGGNHWAFGNLPGASGGSGGGGGIDGWAAEAGGAASPAGQGYSGASSSVNGSQAGAAGGGGGGAGTNGLAPSIGTGGNGGYGLPYSISGAAVTYAGGGGGAAFGPPYAGLVQGQGGAGQANAGGGGMANFSNGSDNGTGGRTGIVIVRYSVIPLSVVVSSPTNTMTFDHGASITATATVFSGTAPYTVQFYTNFAGGAYASAGSGGTSPYTVTLGSPTFGTYGIYATVIDAHGNGTNSLTNTFTVVPPTKLVITDVNGANSPAAGAVYSVTVQAQDATGTRRPVAVNTDVALSLTSGSSLGGTLTGTILSGSSSVTFLNVTNKVAQGVTLQASATSGASLTEGTVSYTIVPAAVNGDASTVLPSPAFVEANGSQTSTITVTLIDAFGNPVPGKGVTVVSSEGTDTIETILGTSGADGVASFTIKSSTVGTSTLTATDTTDSLTINHHPTVTFREGTANADKSTVTASSAEIWADGTDSTTITVTLKDASDHLLSGRSVDLIKTSGSAVPIITMTPATTVGGVVTFVVKSTTAGDDELSAVVESSTVGHVSVSFKSFGSVYKIR